MWFASQFCQAVYSHSEGKCPLQGYEEETHPLFYFFFSSDSDFSFSKPYVLSHCHSLLKLCLPLFFIICLTLLPCSLPLLSGQVYSYVGGWYTLSEAQPALGLGAIFPHPSVTVADSVCPTEKVMLVSRSESHSSVAATLLELSHPAVLSHQQALAQAGAGSRTGNLREEQHQAAVRSRPAQHFCPHYSFS